MNWDRIEGNWKQVRGKVQQQWGKLTDDDLTTGLKAAASSWSARSRSATASPKTRPRSKSTTGSGICRQASVSRASSRFEEVAARLSFAIFPRHDRESWARSIVRVPLP
mgnify:CR=1 FL=1